MISGGMEGVTADQDEEPLAASERATLCLPDYKTGRIAHNGERGYREESGRHLAAAENWAAERLVHLKSRLRRANTEDFWSILIEDMTNIAGAQYGFVAKRILVDDQDSLVEMPRLGEPGSCLMGVAFYYNDGHGTKDLKRDYRYTAYGAPCAHMRHDKVFLIPDTLNQIIPDNANDLPFPPEAYLGVPLFAEGKCFAHFGMMWSAEGASVRSLSWTYLEMFLHSLEDLILDRLLEAKGFAKTEGDSPQPLPKTVISNQAVSVSQSLRPYARSLSHELRTPMQGVVGMLDVMHATVQEAQEDHCNSGVGGVLRTLKENIEVVQDSSRRAVEAADNVVHAYDLNMEVPDTPLPPMDDGEQSEDSDLRSAHLDDPQVYHDVANDTFHSSGLKRRRSTEMEWNIGSAWKYRAVESSPESPMPSPRQGAALSRRECAKQAVRESDRLTSQIRGDPSTLQLQAGHHGQSTPEIEPAATPSLRHTKLRELLHHIISESLRVGGRPEYAIAHDTERGETIEVRSRSSNGEINSKIIEWTVDSAVPETLLVDERDLAKLISCVFLNALKFTEHGKITLTASLSPKSRFVVINIMDTGPGIPQAFLPNLFKPFSREDDSLTRQKDGLGLGLLVAKGLVRKIGGDLTCTRSETAGPNHGSEFEIRMPVASPDALSYPGTPLARTPTPSIPHFSLDRDFPRTEQSGSDAKEDPISARETNGSPRVQTLRSSTTATTTTTTRVSSPLGPSSPSRHSPSRRTSTSKSKTKSGRRPGYNKRLAEQYPLRFLVAEDNKINRKLLVSMLRKLGYTNVCEAYDGAEAVRQMAAEQRDGERPIDIVLMDLWMPSMDGYEATRRILTMPKYTNAADGTRTITVLAVTADVTAEALERAAKVGMEGFMTKPYKLLDLERLIIEYCVKSPSPLL